MPKAFAQDFGRLIVNVNLRIFFEFSIRLGMHLSFYLFRF